MANFITLLRFLLVFPTMYVLMSEQKAVAVFLIGAGALSDFFDGSLARKNREESAWGALLDPLVDKVFFLSLLAVFVYIHRVNPYMYVLFLIRELSISFLRSLALQKGYVMSASYLGKIKAFFEFASLLLLSLESSLSLWSLWIALFLAYASMWDYLVKYLSFDDRR
ncbi:MAG: CDP-alcohol phosphatidyltransferase family protein [Aquificaceae bacterium]